MKLSVGDFILVNSAIYGYSPESHMEVGPFIVQVVRLLGDQIECRHFLSLEKDRVASSLNTITVAQMIAKIDPRDVEILFKIRGGK